MFLTLNIISLFLVFNLLHKKYLFKQELIYFAPIELLKYFVFTDIKLICYVHYTIKKNHLGRPPWKEDDTDIVCIVVRAWNDSHKKKGISFQYMIMRRIIEAWAALHIRPYKITCLIVWAYIRHSTKLWLRNRYAHHKR